MTKVLIAEDDLLIADMLQDVMVSDGYEVCGIARTVDEAIAIGEREKPDLAVLDLRLAAGGLGTEVARKLDRDATSVLYATGNAGQITLTSDDGEACITKPYRSSDILRAMKIVEGMAHGGKAAGPFPRGFSVLGARAAKSVPFHVPTESELDVARLLRQQSALARFGTFALSETSLAVILREAARICAECLEVPFCKVCRYRAEENDLLVEAGVGWKPSVVGIAVSRADESTPQGRAFTSEKPVVCTDLRTDMSFLLPSFYAEHGIVASLDVVIKKKEGQPWGVLEIDNPNIHKYGEHDIDFVTGFANVLAEAVNTAQRNEAAVATLGRMRDMVADRDRLLGSQAKLITEREILTQELQHRVRNNLQLVYSMLSRLVETAGSDDTAGEIRAVARRVMTLSNVYDHLLGRDLESTIDFGGYLLSLCMGFRDLEDSEHEGIQLTCDTTPLMLDIDTSTAIGLIIAELISNSYRHAFPTGKGQINVSLQTGRTATEAVIIFSDDGAGYVVTAGSKRRGLGLVVRLMEQVGGSATVVSGQGTVWTLRFPVPAMVSRRSA
jgi:two-component sensor histidine kinase/DNA-binding response OmpR family regulator